MKDEAGRTGMETQVNVLEWNGLEQGPPAHNPLIHFFDGPATNQLLHFISKIACFAFPQRN